MPLGPRLSVPPALCRGVCAAALVLAVAACGGEAPPEPHAQAEAPAPATAPPGAAARIYEREVVFMTTDTDSALVVPWLFSALDRGPTVERKLRGWLSRNGAWEAFLDEAWETGATRAPWRLVPKRPLRLVVGPDDALERIIYQEGARNLEVGFGGLLAEWTGGEGRVFRIHEGSAVLSTQRVDGVLLDINRTRPPGDVHGEWIFLVSGDSLEVFVDGIRPVDVPIGGAAGWGRVDFRQLEWPDLRLEWTEQRAFERARRDVPVAWTVTSVDGSMDGSVSVETTEIEAGSGDGPRLPVDALFEVSGQLDVEGVTVPVHGLLRHTQN